MNRTISLETMFFAALVAGGSWLLAGCGTKVSAQAPALAATAGTGPLPVTVEPDLDANNFQVNHAERFPLVTAGEYMSANELNVTGVVQADVSRQGPVPSLAHGRIVEICRAP